MRVEFSLKKFDCEEMKKDMAVATGECRVKGPQEQFEDTSRDLASELLLRIPCDRPAMPTVQIDGCPSPGNLSPIGLHFHLKVHHERVI